MDERNLVSDGAGAAGPVASPVASGAIGSAGKAPQAMLAGLRPNLRRGEVLDDAERLARLRLARSENVGPRTWVHLMDRFESAVTAIEALPALAGLGGRRGYVACPMASAEDEIARGRAAGARLVVLGERGYPERLAHISSAPPVIWVRGAVERLSRPATAVVGARNASALGLRQARRLGRGLALEGEMVVSGLARGIDTAAHEGALSAVESAREGAQHALAEEMSPASDPRTAEMRRMTRQRTGRARPVDTVGQTIAVMAGGIDVAYPAENAALAERIVETGGALISECPPGTVPAARHFPRRNRLVSGLADGVVLVEAALRSGSLITARTALDQGREVMACPGAAEDPRAGGCNALIRDGAGLVRDHRDVLEALGPLRARGMAEDTAGFDAASGAPSAMRQLRLDDGALAERVHAILSPAPTPIDEVARLCDATPSALALAIIELELAGRAMVMSGHEIAAIGA
ncbi:MAG: DNA-processing protein DprA [Pseudomonadota bacterium]